MRAIARTPVVLLRAPIPWGSGPALGDALTRWALKRFFNETREEDR